MSTQWNRQYSRYVFSKVIECLEKNIPKQVRLNYDTIHHNPPRPTTIQNISTTTHNHPPPSTTTHQQPKYVHHQPPSTSTHHQPKYINHHPPPSKTYPPLPTISQKMDRQPAKVKVYSYMTSFRHCFNSLFFFEMQYSFPWRRFCVIKFWSVRFSNSKFLLHSVLFTVFKIF